MLFSIILLKAIPDYYLWLLAYSTACSSLVEEPMKLTDHIKQKTKELRDQ